MNASTNTNLKLVSVALRKRILRALLAAGGGHVGGSMSVADCMAALYGGAARVDPARPDWPDRDKIILSKGHSGVAQYAALAHFGFFDEALLETMNNDATMLPSHTDRTKVAGIEMSTGSLGQGASMAAGYAYADRVFARDSKTWLILGDGELNEGQVWEALMFISHHRLTNLITIVDQNGLQSCGRTRDICDLDPLGPKLAAFGLRVIEVPDGNDADAVFHALQQAKLPGERPAAVLLHTKKGAGLSLFEDKPSCHYCGVTQDIYEQCMRELEAQEAAIREECAC